MKFIERIVEEKKVEIALKQKTRPVAELQQATESPVRDFRAAISGGNKVIAELKARTPSIESFEQTKFLDGLASVYADNGAAAISVVTDENNFGTSLETVRRVRDQVALPVVVKDFIIDPYQVIEARAAGADAILLIVRLLDWNGLTALLDLTRQLGMSALVETHNEKEMKMALATRNGIVGVNNRDLDTFEVSLDVTRRLARLVPADVLLVAESGIHGRREIEELAAAGANAFLVGGSLLSSKDPGGKLRELTGQE